MDRRTFLKTAGSAAVASTVGSLGPRGGAGAEEATIGEGMRTIIAVHPGWFSGSHVERVEQIAANGFRAFEDLGAGRWNDKEAVRAKCQELGIKIGAIGAGGSIGGAGPNDPAYHPRFVESVKRAVENAKKLGTKILLGLTGRDREGVSKEEQLDAVARAGQLVSPVLEDAGMILVWEGLNVLVDHPGYLLVYSKDGSDLVKRTNRMNVRFLYDIYHQQISEGNLINNIRRYIKEIGHFHFADVPGRHEPGTGEINYKNVFKAIHEAGYRGIVSCEFGKTKPTAEVLKILAECDRW
jgi:hydroxypyruvate isomerase